MIAPGKNFFVGSRQKPKTTIQMAMSTPLRLARQWKNHHTGADAVAFSPDGRSCVSGGEDGLVIIVPIDGAESPQVLQPPCSMMALSVAWQGDRIVIGHHDGAMTIWDATGRTLLANIKAHNYPVRVDISPVAPHWIVTGGFDNKVKIWTLAGQPVRTLDGHTSYVWSVQILAGRPTAGQWIRRQYRADVERDDGRAAVPVARTFKSHA